MLETANFLVRESPSRMKRHPIWILWDHFAEICVVLIALALGASLLTGFGNLRLPPEQYGSGVTRH